MTDFVGKLPAAEETRDMPLNCCSNQGPPPILLFYLTEGTIQKLREEEHQNTAA